MHYSRSSNDERLAGHRPQSTPLLRKLRIVAGIAMIVMTCASCQDYGGRKKNYADATFAPGATSTPSNTNPPPATVNPTSTPSSAGGVKKK